MMAVDTNILVHAHRRELPHYHQALGRLRALAEGERPWSLPVFCLGEFVRVVTHGRLFDPPSTLQQAIAALRGLLASPTLRVLNPGPRFPSLFEQCLLRGDARGNIAFDAQIAAVCLEHGVDRLLTLDRDFHRFPEIEVVRLG